MNLAAVAVESAQPESETEVQLKDEIKSPWAAHQESKATARNAKQELQALRLDLGRKLAEVKATLVCTGRSGRWSAYLRSCEIPRGSAERYIARHEALLKPKQIESLETVEPDEEQVRRLVRSLLPRLRKVLTTSSWLQWFLAELEYRWETVATGSTGERDIEIATVANGDSGDLHGTEAASHSVAD